MPYMDEKVFKMVQDISNHVLDLTQRTSSIHEKTVKMEAEITIVNKSIEVMEKTCNDLSSKVRQIILLLQQKMEPERCAHMHEELRKGMRRELKENVRGWAKKAVTILKVVALVGAALSGLSFSANQLGILKALGF